MKNFILHLSDIHLVESDKDDWCTKSIETIRNSLSLHSEKSSLLIIIITGDITQSGTKDEFNVAKVWLDDLRNALLQHFADVRISTVPGNHDCNESQNDNVRKLIIDKVTDEGETILESGFIDICTNPLTNYFNFITEIEIQNKPISNKVVWVDQFFHNEKTISINCLNSAWSSSKDESKTRYGKLVLPFTESLLTSKSDLVVSLIHHPYNWFEYSNKIKIQNSLEANSDIILTGHEHYNRIEEKEGPEILKNLTIASSASKDNNKVNYSLIEIDMIDLSFKIISFLKGKEKGEAFKGSVRKNNKLRYKYPLNDETFCWINTLPSIVNHYKKDDLFLSDIFIWPRLRHISSDSNIENPILNYSEYKEIFKSSGTKFFIGKQFSGKTSAAKSVFRELNNFGKFVVYVEGKDIGSKHRDNEKFLDLINEKAKNLYSNISIEDSDYDDRILVLDNIGSDLVNYKLINEIISKAEERFFSVLVFVDDGYKIAEISEKSFNTNEQYEIQKLSNNQILLLIEKWLQVGGGSKIDENYEYLVRHYFSLVMPAIESNLIANSPFYITLFLNHAHAVGEDGMNVSSSVHLIEKIITMRHSTVNIPNLGVEGVVNFLSELSFNIYSKNIGHISLDEFKEFCKKYEKDYSLSFEESNVVSTLVKKTILKKELDKIFFNDEYIYFFYLGKYIAQNSAKNKDVRDALENIISKCFREDYSNIIVFTSYFSHSDDIFEKVLEEAKKILSGVEVATLGKDVNEKVSKLNKKVQSLDFTEGQVNYRKNLADFSNERTISPPQKEQNQSIDHNIVIKAFRFVQVLGMMVKNRTGSLKSDVKEKHVGEVVNLSGRIITFVLSILDDNFEEMLVELCKKVSEKSNGTVKEAVMEKKLKELIFRALQYFVVMIIEKVSFYAGSKTMKLVFENLENTNSTNFMKLCNLQVILDYSKEPELSRLEKFSKEPLPFFSEEVTRSMVYRYLVSTKVEQANTQKICKSYNINLKKVNLVSHQKKEEK